MAKRKRAKFEFNDIHGFLQSVFADDVHAKRVYSLAGATLGVMSGASLAIHAIGQGLAQARGTLKKHAVKQVDRLLSNQGIDVWALFAHWVPHVVGASKQIVVALDWTEFDTDGHSTIVLSLVTSHGRATPLISLSVAKAALEGQRNAYEDAVLVRLAEVLPEDVAVTVLADRGFADTKLFHLLEHGLGFDYVIRFRGNTYVTSAKGEMRKAVDWVGAGGRARTLRGACVTAQHYRVNTVVCVHAKEMKEPWCLAASDATATAGPLTRYYAKRWGIESSFRDTKDLRFGMGMSKVRIRQTERRDRLFLLNAFAVALLSLLGAAGEAVGYDRYLKANTVKRRTHSLFRQGCMIYDLLPTMPDKWLRPIMKQFAESLCAKRPFSQVFCL